MSKYQKLIDYWEEDPLQEYLRNDERVLFEFKPKKSAFITNQSLTMMPIALIWLIFDGTFISQTFISGAFFHMAWFMIPFFALHLMPVWIWLKNMLTASKAWSNTSYIFTTKRLLLTSGTAGLNRQSISYNKIRSVELRTGLIDNFLHVSDLHLEISARKNAVLVDLENAEEVYNLLNQIIDNQGNTETLF